MEQGFVDVLKKLIAEQGKEALLNVSKCKAFLMDYTKNEYKKESRLLLQALEAGVQKAIDASQELAICKKQQIRLLHEDYGLDEKLAADVVNILALVLRGDNSVLEAQAAIERGNNYFKNRDYVKAIKEFDEAISLDPNNAKAFVERGRAYGLKHQFDQSISDFTEAIKLDPKLDSAYVGRARIYAVKGQHENIIIDCSEAINLNPKFAEAYGIRGEAYKNLDFYDNSISDCSEAIKLDPNDWLSYLSRGDVYLVKGQDNLAIRDFKEAVRLNPDARPYVLNHPSGRKFSV